MNPDDPAVPRSAARSIARHRGGSRTAIVILATRLFLGVGLIACAAAWSGSPRAAPAAANLSPSAAPAGVQAPSQWANEWSRGAVFYEVFVRSFADSDGDGKGDLKGLISKLDYLNDGDPATTRDLGVDALWLMPIFKSPSYHGYDSVDYEHINPDYGTEADFTRLLDEAHRRGIRIVLDFVVNHTGSGHPWFADSASSPQAAHRDWYVWSGTNPGWTQPWGTGPTWHALNGAFFYGLFWSGMPDLNFRNAEVRTEIERLAGLWLSRGVDGLRLDAARYLVEDGGGAGQQDTPETHAYWKEFSGFVRGARPESILVGENWTETPVIATYFGSTAEVAGGDELPMNFNFPLSAKILEGLLAEQGGGIAAKLAEMQSAYPPGVNDAPFLTNHDQVRLATQLRNDPQRLRLAASILLTMPGAPFIYYGEELGLQNGPTTGDESKRTPMPWAAGKGGGFTTGKPWFPFAPGRKNANVARETLKPASLLSHYRNLIRVRKGSPALSKGDLVLLPAAAGNSSLLSFLRRSGDDVVLVVHNPSSAYASAGPFAIQATSLEQIFPSSSFGVPSGRSGAWSVPIAPRSSGIWKIH